MKTLKEILRDRRPALSSYVFSSDPGVTEILASTGFDFCIVDLEHASLDFSHALAHIRAGEAKGLPVMVRIGDSDINLVGKLLDAGAAGIRIPHYGLDKKSSIATALAARYAPAGHRAVCSNVRTTNYGHKNFAEHVVRANEDVVTFALVEDIEVLPDVENLLKEGRIDMVSPGLGDLATALGVPGQPGHKLVQDAADRVMEAAGRLGIARGGFLRNAADIDLWKRFDPDFLTCAVDYRVLADAYLQLRKSFRP